jgi:pimeloyl-ACP methyl ester carboxylesterase
VSPGGVGVLGFSFGATQALVAAAGDTLAGEVRGIAAWGGYRDVRRLFRFGITGEHDWQGVRERMEPDPYGRWIMVGNYLTGIPGHGDATATAAAVHTLALEAGSAGIPSGAPVMDAAKRRLRATLPAAERPLFDLIAPPTGTAVDLAEGARMADLLASAALAADPLLDPGAHLSRLATPTLLAHGRDDRLIPYTEMLRLQRDVPPAARRGSTLTALFAHSGGTRHELGPAGVATEAVRFVALLRRILERV